MKRLSTRHALVSGLLLGAAVVACGSNDAGGASPPSASPDEAGTGTETAVGMPDARGAQDARESTDSAADSPSVDGSNSGSMCNNLPVTAPYPNTRNLDADAPTPTGGAIAAGEYYWTETDTYDPGHPSTPVKSLGISRTLVITGNVIQRVEHLMGGATLRATQTFAVVSGTTLQRDFTCPAASVGPDLPTVYSVNGSTLTLYVTDNLSHLVFSEVYVHR